MASKTLVKLGLYPYLVDVVSAAAAEVLSQPLAVAASVFHHRVACPIDMVVMAHYIGSWMLPTGKGEGLEPFANLSRRHGDR